MSDNIIKSAVNGTITGNLMETVLKGLSEYELARKNGYTGTEKEWLKSRNIQYEVTNTKNLENGEGVYTIKFISGNIDGETIEVTTPDLLPINDVADRIIDLITPTLNEKVDKITTVNSKKLDTNIVLSMDDIPVSYSDATTAKIYTDNKIDSLKSYTDGEISKIIGLAPETLNSFEEISNALGKDEKLSETLNNAISLKADKTSVEKSIQELQSNIDLKANSEDVAENISEIQSDISSMKTDISNKVDVVKGYSLVSDSEIERLANVKNYDDTSVVEMIETLESRTVKTDVLNGYVALPRDGEGNIIIGNAGQILQSNGDGTYSWITIVTGFGEFYIQEATATGEDNVYHTFVYEIGMTWEEFVYSKYNTGFVDNNGNKRTLYIEDDKVKCSDNSCYNADGSIYDLIINKTTYYPTIFFEEIIV